MSSTRERPDIASAETSSAASPKSRRGLLFMLILAAFVVGYGFGIWYERIAEGETWTRWHDTDLVIGTRSEAPVLITHLEAVYAVQLPQTSRTVFGIALLPQPLVLEHRSRYVLRQ